MIFLISPPLWVNAVKALIGTAEEEGDDRAIKAAERALNNQLLDDVKLEHATGVLVNVTGGDDLGLLEVDRAVNMIKEAASENAKLIFGASSSQKLQGKIRITILATGITHHHSEMPIEESEETETETITEDKATTETSETEQSTQTEAEIIKIDDIRQDMKEQAEKKSVTETVTAEQTQIEAQTELPAETQSQSAQIQSAQPIMPQSIMPQQFQPQQATQQQVAQQQYIQMQQAQTQHPHYLNRNGSALPIHEMVISDDPINVPHHYRQNMQQMPSQVNVKSDNIDVNNYSANLKLEQLRAKIHFAHHEQPNTQIDNHTPQDMKHVQSQLDDISKHTQQPANGQHPQHYQNDDAGMVEHTHTQSAQSAQYDTPHDDINVADSDHHHTEYNAYDSYNYAQHDEAQHEYETSENEAQQSQSQYQGQADTLNMSRSKKMPFKLKRGGASDADAENQDAENNNEAPLEQSKKKREFSNQAKTESFDLPFDNKASDEDVAKEAVNGGKMLSRKELDIPAFLRRQAN